MGAGDHLAILQVAANYVGVGIRHARDSAITLYPKMEELIVKGLIKNSSNATQNHVQVFSYCM